MSETQNKYPEIEIDKEGKFKYIQIKITNKENKEDTRIIIRGSAKFKFHNDIFKDFMEKANIDADSKYTFEPIGGGKITINGKDINIFGESTVYGPADHEKTSQMLEKHFGKDKYKITWEKTVV
jgi:phosphohistidine phosphatase